MSINSWTGVAAYEDVARAIVISADADQGTAATRVLELAGCRTRGHIQFHDAASDMSHFDGLDLILIEAAAASDALLDTVLARADALARERSVAVVASIAPDQIDIAAAQLLGHRTQILVDPSDAERFSAVSAAKWLARGKLNDVGRDAETERLHRLNEEVARIADTLAQLTRGDAASQRVRAPGAEYRMTDDGDAVDASSQEIRSVIRARRMRGQFFADSLFGDPAWDMLLDLFAAGLEHRSVSVSSLCIAAAVPPTTALRWIGTMHEAGLFERRADPSDRRRAYVGLSGKGTEGMRAYVSTLKRSGLPLV
jgi:hypothetical protein